MYSTLMNSTHLVNLNKFNQAGWTSDQPVISGDGFVIAYRSSATNLVFEDATVEVVNGGLVISDLPQLL